MCPSTYSRVYCSNRNNVEFVPLIHNSMSQLFQALTLFADVRCINAQYYAHPAEYEGHYKYFCNIYRFFSSLSHCVDIFSFTMMFATDFSSCIGV